MTATLTAEPPRTTTSAAPARRGSLLRAEVHRMLARRFVQVLVLVGAIGFALSLLLASTQFATPSAGSLAEAQAELEQVLADSRTGYEQCLTSSDLPQGQTPEQYCGTPPTAEAFGGVEQFLDKRPFVLGDHGLSGATAVAGATAAIAFVLGATWIGAEWSSRSIVALLFWEPRRRRVMLTKLAVLAATAAGLAALAQAVWALAATVLAETRGGTTAPPGFWGDLAASSGRGVLLVVLVALLGFAFANLVRNTAAALGVGFVYVVVVEWAVKAARPAWQEWLLSTNAAALVQDGGASFFVYGQVTDANGVVQFTDREVLVSNLHGGLVVTAVTLVAVGLGVLLFSRRDLS